ncbi:MAG: ribonucleoside-diphosphate reductase, adenosylcobalamin-dependent [Ramlibacter sp.]|nr:ribonucleoside-diphosphate reductase, adenosylcobalamin-dependent [Ramlibacter sp.]
MASSKAGRGSCEEPLPAYGCCDLGPVILTRFVSNPFGIGGQPEFNFDAFAEAVALQVRALDNVLEITHWPLDQQRAEAMAKRRIGVGFTGLGNTLAMLRLRYDRPEGRELARRIAERMRDAAYSASVELAREKGAFPALNIEQYLEEGTFASRLSEPLQQAIRTHGIRNSHLLAIAPTGTVSLAFADNASNGIEPAFSWSYRRKKREADGSTTEYAVEDHAWRLYRALGGDMTRLPEYFVSALQMSVTDHLAMMEAVQPYVDTAISKTVNIPEDYPYEDFKHLYHEAWKSGLKGMATYRPNPILGSVLDTGAAAPASVEPAAAPQVDPMRAVNELNAAIDDYAARERHAVQPVDPMRSVIAKRPKGVLPGMVEKVEYWTQQGRQALYLVVSFIPLPDGRERAVEFFMPVGQSGESQEWITASMRLLSLAARGGFLDRALSDMRKVAWDRGPVRLGTYQKADGTSVPMWHDSEVAAIAFSIQNLIAQRNGATALASASIDASDGSRANEANSGSAATGVEGGPPLTLAGSKCPECGAHAMIRKDGCDYCTQCGHLGSCG